METPPEPVLLPATPPLDPVAYVPRHDEHGRLRRLLALLAVCARPGLAPLLLIGRDGVTALLVKGGYPGCHGEVPGVHVRWW